MTKARPAVPYSCPSRGDVTAVVAGRDHALAVGADGAVWAWGANDSALYLLDYGGLRPEPLGPSFRAAIDGVLPRQS